ncbi:MAG: TylF/MycF/NovP-related O-methyltransferase [Bryobacteraceae bacterium]
MLRFATATMASDKIQVLTVESELYLDLLKNTLTRVICPEQVVAMVFPKHGWQAWTSAPLRLFLARKRFFLARRVDLKSRQEGRDWPADGETMIGVKRLENIRYCILEALGNNVPGDVIETGVWRGGACIFMRAILKVADDRSRRVWVADSFEGLPHATLAADRKDKIASAASRWQELAVSIEDVKANFAKYGLLDDRVCFLKGWFKDTLPRAPIERLAVARLDGDMYESTWDALSALYPKLSPGGFLIVDDYNDWPVCRQAVDEYRERFKVREPIVEIDHTAVFWRKQF